MVARSCFSTLALLIYASAAATQQLGPETGQRLSPTDLVSLNSRGIALLRAGEFADAARVFADALRIAPDAVPAARNRALSLLHAGRAGDARSFAEAWLARGGGDSADGDAPSLRALLALARAGTGDAEGALAAFLEAASTHPAEALAWQGAVDQLLLLGRAADAVAVAEHAVLVARVVPDHGRLLRARARAASWRDWDALSALVRRLARHPPPPPASPVRSADLGSAPAALIRLMNSRQALESAAAVSPSRADSAALRLHEWCARHSKQPPLGQRRRRLRIAFLTADLGDHPAAVALEAALAGVDRSRAHVTVISTAATARPSFWRDSVAAAADALVDAGAAGGASLAELVRGRAVDVLVDFNGHTVGSHMAALAHQPAPLQVAFAGYMATTGAPFVDAWLSDPVTTPVEAGVSAAFSERLILRASPPLPTSHARLQPHVPFFSRPARPPLALAAAKTVLSFHGALHKVTPRAFSAWTNILRRVPGSALWVQDRPAHADALTSLRHEAAARGVLPARIVAIPLSGWIQHIRAKSAAHIALDSPFVNGHSTTADALWAGVPVVTVPSDAAWGRLAASLLLAHGCGELIATELSDYEDMVVRLATQPRARRTARLCIEGGRRAGASSLFFPEPRGGLVRSFRAALEAKCAAPQRSSVPEETVQGRRFIRLGMHVQMPPTAPVPTESFASRVVLEAQREVLAQPWRALRLHIGAATTHPEWTGVGHPDTAASPETDVVARVGDPLPFPPGSAVEVYASHVLEHVPLGAAGRALRAWAQVLAPGRGVLRVAVPDVAALGGLLHNGSLSLSDEVTALRIVYGGHVDGLDEHHSGFTPRLLEHLLQDAGFCSITRTTGDGMDETVLGRLPALARATLRSSVPSVPTAGFGPVPDSSGATAGGALVSLNYIAVRCATGEGSRAGAAATTTA